MQGALVTQWTPDQRRLRVQPNATHLDPHLPLELKDCLRLMDGEGGEDVPIVASEALIARPCDPQEVEFVTPN